MAPLPQGYGGEFGPNLKSLCLLFAHLCNMTEPKIADLLANVGILISDGQISNLLSSGQEQLQAEKEEIVEAGLSSSPWQHLDDTGTPVNGRNRHCQVLCNPLYTAYTTTIRKDRLTIIDVLRNQRERIFLLNEEAFGLMGQFKAPQRVMEKLRQMPSGQEWSEAEFSEQTGGNGRLTQDPNRPEGVGQKQEFQDSEQNNSTNHVFPSLDSFLRLAHSPQRLSKLSPLV